MYKTAGGNHLGRVKMSYHVYHDACVIFSSSSQPELTRQPFLSKMDPVAEEVAVVRQGAIAVTSCEEESSSEDEEYQEQDPAHHEDNNNNNNEEDLFDHRADEENEAYVYKHLRSGVEEVVPLHVVRVRGARTAVKSSSLGQQQPQQHHIKVLRPRNSDAVLSCPCCFTIVCMDCQQHERYDNLYRAMFVQSIAVRWDCRLRYDESKRLLVPVPQQLQPQELRLDNLLAKNKNSNGSSSSGSCCVVEGESKSLPRDDDANETIYYTVCCANCHTVVASLDMNDEVYYFANCLTSS